MDKRLGFVMVLSASALAWVGCDGDPAPEDGGPCVPGPGVICLEDGGTDAEVPADSGPRPDSGPEVCRPAPVGGGTAGSACRSGGTMCTGMACNPEIGLRPPLGNLFVGSMCGDECNPNAATDECGECADCSEFSYLGRLRVPEFAVGPDGMALIAMDGVCRPLCTPDPAGNGGCRTGYTCDIDRGICVGACQTDAQCNINGETLEADPAGEWTCNTTTGRCELEGTVGAAAGDACTADSECMDNGQCLTGDAIPDGFCTRLNCNAAGFECGTGETCSLHGLGGPSWCLPSCMVGAEPEADRLGAGGHGMGCDPGAACKWDGRSAEATGGCQPAEYNDITTPNIGGACETSADCYSPFGYGVCLAGGVCSMSNCTDSAMGILPNVTTTLSICDPAANELCVRSGGTAEAPETLCILTCDSATECAPGYACNTEILSGGMGVCWNSCTMNSECRTGVACVNEVGSACVPNGPDGMPGTEDDDVCACADLPRPDAGTDADAGTTEDAGTAADAGVDASTTP